ncbi:MAG: adenylyltransferase/cytidyltransferase family protein, partial [Candidatus Kapabacteria bacterium]|nr:adenylyltransferase/cytidyltransferase family protein [Candidatus Kapabacteria bacterium]
MILTKEQLNQLRETATSEEKSIVFTNGCFDILHAGHVTYLQEAKTLGDILIVGLNSDDSVRRLKGALRPINTQNDRACVLDALRCIDYVVVFDEDTPYNIIKSV